MNHLSIRQMADAVPGCNILVNTWKGTVIYNGPYDKLPEHLLDEIPNRYIYAPLEKTIKIRLSMTRQSILRDLSDVKPWMYTILKDIRGSVLYEGFRDEIPEKLECAFILDYYMELRTMTVTAVLDI